MKDFAEASSLAAEAYGVVRQRIVRGELMLGEVISRRKLAVELGMSFLPVSEALLRLELEGLLESRPRAGTRVRIPSRDDVRGQFVVREALEVQAAMLFAEIATAAERAELLKLGSRVDAASTHKDRALYVAVHEKLHRRIAEGARCPALTDAIEKSHALASTWFCVTRQPSPDVVPNRHRNLSEVLARGNPGKAAQAMRKHIAEGMEHTLEQLQPYFRLRKANGRTFFRSERKSKSTTWASTTSPMRSER